MFPLNPWGRRRKFARTLPRRDGLLAAYRLVFALAVFHFGFQLLLLLALLAWWNVGRDETWDGWLILSAAALFVLLYLWLTWRFLRRSWFAAQRLLRTP